MSLGTAAVCLWLLGQMAPGSRVRFHGAERFVAIANLLVAATAFLCCPRRHLRRKGVTLFCLLPAAALFVGAMLEWLLITWPRQFMTVSQLLHLV